MDRREATARFTALITRPPAEVPLDECAFLIAAHDHEVDVAAQLSRLDDLAARCTDPTFVGLRNHLFVYEGFRGNDLDYDDQDNSFLDRVLDRGLGLPILLAVVAIEVGRRVDVPVVGVNAPGHFLVRHGRIVFDPFHGGRILRDDEASAVLARAPEPAPTRTILDRMLVNLQHRYAAEGDRDGATWVTRLRMRFPESAARTAWLN
jgi:regulator of sirC expression with transglutaminase-like and TPR domain